MSDKGLLQDSSSQPVLQCKGLSKHFHQGNVVIDVLKNIDFTLYSGDQVAVIGSSGSGKSTFLHLLGGLDRPTSGEVWVNGTALAGCSQNKLCNIRNFHIGFVYQSHHLLSDFTVLENVCMPLCIRGVSYQQAKPQALDFIKKVHLEDRISHKIGALSGGERSRTAIARALITRPTCVLADEPTGNLDESTAHVVYECMLELNRTRQTSFIIVTHNIPLARKMDKIYKLEHGKLVQ